MALRALDNLGEELPLRVRAAAKFGLYTAEMVAASGLPFDLTDCVIRGAIRVVSTGQLVLLITATVADDPTTGAYTFGWSTEDSLVLARYTAQKLEWGLELIDTAGEATPLYYGPVVANGEVAHG